MKRTIAILGMFLTLTTFAETGKKYVHPSSDEIAKNQSCFQELETQGCGKFEDDHDKFRSCMSGVYETMEDHCRTMMLKLYGTK